MKVIITAIFAIVSSACFSQFYIEKVFPNLTFDYITELQNSGIKGDDRMFVVSQDGYIRVIENKDPNPKSSIFLDLTSDVVFRYGAEIGLLGLAFHPKYATNGYLYVYYTSRRGLFISCVVERFTVSKNNPNQVNVSTRQKIFSVKKNQIHSNHNGGKILFGNDGYLYISIGDGGGGGDPRKNAQNTKNFFGSILRIDVDINGDNPKDNNGILPDGQYEIPSTNPLVGKEGYDEIYSWGIRNTWKMSCDKTTGRIWAGDVGQGSIEEVNLIKPGNYGWNYYEGTSVYNSNVPKPKKHIPPVFEYSQDNGDKSITGGYIYRGATLKSIVGKYIFGDFVSGRIWSMDYNSNTNKGSSTLLLKAENISISTFGIDNYGELYLAHYGKKGSIYKLSDKSQPDKPVHTQGIGEWQTGLGKTNGPVHAIVSKNKGEMYAAGSFTEIGHNTPANNIAKWTDGLIGWEAIGKGVNGAVYALAIDPKGNLYVGGKFTKAGDVNVNNIAKYSSTGTWSAIKQGTDGIVQALEWNDNKLYVGGIFKNAGGVLANNIAQWNGNQWQSLTDKTTKKVGTNNEIRSLETDKNGNLYIGGNFTLAGGNSANRIALWDGSNWKSLGDGTSGFVHDILAMGDDIYACGNFTIAGGKIVNRIAQWSTSDKTWSSLNNGLSGSANSIATDGKALYVGGLFANAQNKRPTKDFIVNNVVQWSKNTGWKPLGKGKTVGVSNVVNVLHFQKDNLYTGGKFDKAGGKVTTNLAFCGLKKKITSTTTATNLPTVEIYPNPATKSIHLSGIENDQKIIVRIMTVSSLLKLNKQGNIRTIDISTLQPGMYIVSIVAENANRIMKSYKLIVQ